VRDWLVVVTASCLMLACATHVLGDADTSSLRADARAACHVWRDLDGGLDKALVRGIYLDEVGILHRSGIDVDGGPSACEGQ
jgi:hypothetical protein